MASTDAMPIPKKNTALRVYFPIMDADGDLVTGATGLDSEVSLDGGTFADCTNEATEIATSSGIYYLDLTSAEMNADAVCVIVKTSSSGAKTTTLIMYPEEAGDIRVNATQLGGTAQTGRDIGASVLLSPGTGTGQLSITSGVVAANAVQLSGDATAADNAESFFDGTGYAGTNNVIPTVTTVNGLANNTITANSIAADAITAAKIATNAIDADAIAADAVTEIQSGLSTYTGADTAGTTTLLSRLSATRAGYLDNLSVGAVAQASALSTLDGKIGTPSDLGGGATLAQNLSDIEAQTDDIGAAGAGLTALGDSRLANLDAAVSSRSTYAGGDTSGTTTLLGRVTSTRAGYFDNLSAGAVATAAALATVDTIADKLDTALELDGAVWRFTTNALEQAPVTSAAPTVSDIADEVQTRTIAAVTVVNGLANNTVTAAALATDAVTEIQNGLATAAAVSALPTATQNADALLNRDLSTGTDSGSTTVRTPRQALRFLRNRWAISGGVLTVYKEDDATSSWSAAATQTAGDPVSAIDPAGP